MQTMERLGDDWLRKRCVPLRWMAHTPPIYIKKRRTEGKQTLLTHWMWASIMFLYEQTSPAIVAEAGCVCEWVSDVLHACISHMFAFSSQPSQYCGCVWQKLDPIKVAILEETQSTECVLTNTQTNLLVCCKSACHSMRRVRRTTKKTMKRRKRATASYRQGGERGP